MPRALAALLAALAISTAACRSGPIEGSPAPPGPGTTGEDKARQLVASYLREVFGPERPSLETFARYAGSHAEIERLFEDAECNRRWGFPYARDEGRIVLTPRCRAFLERRERNPDQESSLFLEALRSFARLEPTTTEVGDAEEREDGYRFHLRSPSGERSFLLRVHPDPMLADLQGSVTLIGVDGRSVHEEVRPEIAIADGYSEEEIERNIKAYLEVAFGPAEPTLEDHRRLLGYGEQGMERALEMAACAHQWEHARDGRYLQHYPEDSPCRKWIAERVARPGDFPSLTLRKLRERYRISADEIARLEIRVVEGPRFFYQGRMRVEARDGDGEPRLEFSHLAHPIFAEATSPASLETFGEESVAQALDPW